MISAEIDARIMRRAIELAEHNRQFPFGAVITESGSETILAEGWNRGSENPTWHGEIVAINDFFSREQQPETESLTLYTTAEPCPMCQSAIHWAGIDRVVYGTSIPTLISLGFQQISLRASDIQCRAPFQECELTGGLLKEECDRLFKQARELVE